MWGREKDSVDAARLMSKPPIPNEVWRLMQPEEKLRGLLNMSLEEIYEILDEPIDYRNSILMQAKTQVVRALLNSCVKLGIEDRRTGKERSAVLAAITKQMQDEAKTISAARAPKPIDVLDEPIH
jgi:hypothetical protein